VAVIDGLTDARNGARALREAGFVDDDVRLALASEVTAIDDACSARGLFARIVAGIRTLGDEGIVAAAYVAEARCGHHMLIVYAPGDALRQRAHEIVARHRAHTVNYFGRWVIRGL
jgi:hypothetical protein